MTNLTYRFQKTQDGEYAVLINSKIEGIVKKVPCGWESFTMDGKAISYRQGARKHSADEIAVYAGLLDGNYNAI